MQEGYVVNNTGKARHIFKRTVYPGGRVPLGVVFDLLKDQVTRGTPFLVWLCEYIPPGWEVVVVESFPPAELFATPEVHSSGSGSMAEFSGMEDNNGPHLLEEATVNLVPEQLTAREIFNLQVKDNPKRVISQISSVHKLRRALSLCKKDSRKKLLTKILRDRIKDLVE